VPAEGNQRVEAATRVSAVEGGRYYGEERAVWTQCARGVRNSPQLRRISAYLFKLRVVVMRWMDADSD
jgi:hypothetical protein